MILRSPLRMNKNIVFPFISCIMIMLTLLVLIHKSADELNAVKKEISQCKQQYDSTYTQLQSAIEYKLRLEKSLDNEKTNVKQKMDEMKTLLVQEKEERRKEKEEGDNRYEALNQRYILKENENKELMDDNEKYRKKIIEMDAVRADKDELIAAKDKLIDELKEKLKQYNENIPSEKRKVTPETNDNNLRLHAVEGQVSIVNGSSTPVINPQAVGGMEPSDVMQKQVGVIPPPLAQPNKEKDGNLQEQMRNDLNIRNGEEQKLEEHVIKSPDEEKKDIGQLSLDGENNGGENAFLPLPPNQDNENRPKASSASNNAAERQLQIIAAPIGNEPVEKNKEIPRHMKDYQGVDYGKNVEEEDEEEYMDGDQTPKKSKNALKEKIQQQQQPPQDDSFNLVDSVMLNPK